MENTKITAEFGQYYQLRR